jgi:hypothetical protein
MDDIELSSLPPALLRWITPRPFAPIIVVSAFVFTPAATTATCTYR